MTQTQICAECKKENDRNEMIEFDGKYICSECKPVFVNKLKEGIGQIYDDFLFAGFWKRVAASIIDSLILIPLTILTFVNLLYIKNIVLLLFIGIIGVLYKVVMEGFKGATLGKMAVAIVIADLKGNVIGFKKSFLRNILYILSGTIGIISSLILFQLAEFNETNNFTEIGQLQNQIGLNVYSQLVGLFMFISCIFVLFQKQKRTLYDLWAGTVSIEKESPILHSDTF